MLGLALSPLALGGGSASGPEIVGGIEVGSAGTGIYTGYTLSWGDDFNGALNLVHPANPHGRYIPTRGGSVVDGGPRDVRSTLDMYMVDPYHTGDSDTNKGTAVASFADSMVQSNSLLILKARKFSGDEQDFMTSARNTIGTVIHSAACIMVQPPGIIECRFKSPLATSNPAGYHATFWAMMMNPIKIVTELEVDWESNNNGANIAPNYVTWSGGSSSAHGGTDAAFTSAQTLYTIEIALDALRWYKDGALSREVSFDSSVYGKPLYLIFNIPVIGAQYSDLQWTNAGAAGATAELDYWRVWRASGSAHYRALATQADIAADFNVAFSQVLDTKTAVWGNGSVTEVVEALPVEANEPGGNYTTDYSAFPSGMSYTAGTRTLAGTISDKPGRIHVVRYVTGDGISCEPQHFCVNIGPKAATLTLPAGQPSVAYSYTVPYSTIDVGTLTPKTWGVSGLPSGLSGATVNGELVISGTPVGSSSGTITVTCTNSVGQSAQVQATLDISTFTFDNAEAAAYVARMTTVPNDTRKGLIDDLFGSLKVGAISGTNLLTKLDALYLLKAHASDAAILNAISTSFNCTLEDAPTFTVDAGYAFDGSNDALSTNFNPATAGGQYARDSAMFAMWIGDTGQVANAAGGWNDGTDGVTLNPRNTSDQLQFRINQASASAVASITNASGFSAVNRSGASATQAYKAGVAQTVGTNPNQTSTALNSFALRIGRTLTASWSARTVYCCAFGGSLTANEHADLYNALNTYFTGF